MSLDSLLQDLERMGDSFSTTHDERLVNEGSYLLNGPTGSHTQGAFFHARNIISEARQEVARAQEVPVDYRSFVKFLADCRVPVVNPIHFEWGPFLGSGWTMTVHQGLWRAKSEPQAFALKQLNLDLAFGMSSQTRQDRDLRMKMASVTTELRLMSHELLRSHRNIVQLHGITWRELASLVNEQPVTTPVLVVELAALYNHEPLTLESFVNLQHPACQNAANKARLLKEVMAGLHALHSLGAVHGDVKPSNVLLFENIEGLSAKISDFGFCIIEDTEEDQARGDTAFWSPPECLINASPDIRQHKTQKTRDFYSWGLLAWFLLFEELPLSGDAAVLDVAKGDQCMKKWLDEAFTARYREMCRLPVGAELVVRFLIQWVLVRDPFARRHTFTLYQELLTDSARWLDAEEAYKQAELWHTEWEAYGHPQVRLSTQNKPSQKSLYFCEPSKIIGEWGSIGLYEGNLDYDSFESFKEYFIPPDFQRHMLKQTMQREEIDGGQHSAQRQKFIASCYISGFGVDQDIQTGVKWYEKAASAGDADAAQSLLQLNESHRVIEALPTHRRCELMVQVLLARFIRGLPNEAKTDLESCIASLNRELLQDPERSELSLRLASRALLHGSTQDAVRSSAGSDGKMSSDWGAAFTAVEDDKIADLRAALSNIQRNAHCRPRMGSLLHYAVQYGRTGIVRLLVHEFDVDPKSVDEEGLTALARALRMGKTNIVRVLIFSDEHATISPDDAAMDSASTGSGDLTQVIYENFVALNTAERAKGTNLSRFSRWSFFSLSAAMVNNNWASFCALLSIGVSPSITSPPSINAADTFFAPTLLAATNYNALMLAACLAFGASPNIKVPLPDARTPLHLACGKYISTSSGRDASNPDFIQRWALDRWLPTEKDLPALQTFCISLLLRHGADTEARAYDGSTPLLYSLEHGRDRLAAEILVAYTPPANIDARDFLGNTALQRAASIGDLDTVAFCLRNGGNLNSKNVMGETSLAAAAKDGHIVVVEHLLKAGAKIESRDENGQNCLQIALTKGKVEVVRLFQQALEATEPMAMTSVLLNEDCRGWHCLHTCIQKCAVDISVYLPLLTDWLSRVPQESIDRQDLNGWSMLHMAVCYSTECTELLLQRGANPNLEETILGWTPLHYACNEPNFDVMNLLLQYDADWNGKSESGWSPLVVLTQATDAVKLSEGDDFEDHDDDEWEDEDESGEPSTVADDAEEDGWDDEDEQITSTNLGRSDYPISPVDRLRTAHKRARIRARLSSLMAQEAKLRITTSVLQSDIDRLAEAARASFFHLPGDQKQNESDIKLEIAMRRNLRRCFVMDDQGRCVDWAFISPSDASWEGS